MAKKPGAKPGGESLVVGSKVRGFFKAAGMRMQGDTIDAINALLKKTLAGATERTKANGRSTVRPADL